MKQHLIITPVILVCACLLSIILCIDTNQAAATSYADVYQITDLTNRGIDVVLRKSKGVKQPVIPKWTEKNLTQFHVYQLQVACLDEIRRMESKFKMTPYPHIILSPEQLTPNHLYKLSTIILAEVRRIAIHLNIWGLPKEKSTFSGEKPNDIVEETVTLYLKLRVLGGRKTITNQEVAGELGRAIADMKMILNHIDPARRYQDVFPPVAETKSPGQLYPLFLNLRTELNHIRTFYKLPATPLATRKNTKPGVTELFIQSQLILGELNHIKTAAGIRQPTRSIDAKASTSISHQINTLLLLTRQTRPLAATVQQGGR